MTQLASQYAPSARVRWDLIGFGAIVFLIWGGLVFKLTTDWSTNPQYEFGYFVPFFVLYLLARRWEDRPALSGAAASPLVTGALACLLLLLLPIRIVQEANPDWRPLNWVHAVVVVGATFLLFARAGGLSWASHFFVPLLLVFFCLPWPLAMEQGMIQQLTGAVTRVTVELLNWINVPALQRGNVIELAAGSVGVADACSGMRSLAGTLMASAFFGEYYRLGWPRRAALVIGGSIIAFGLNIIRTFFLGWRTAAEGGQAVEAWHDPAGYTIFAISFAALWIVARMISGGAEHPRGAAVSSVPDPRLSVAAMAGLVAWLVGIHVLSESWYRFREGTRIASQSWSIVFPDRGNAARSSDLPDEVRSVLRYSEGTSATVDWPDGRSWNIIVLQWEPGRSSAQLATMHRPEICMPAAGYVFAGPTAPLDLHATGLQLKFDGTIFDANGQRVFVYRCLWEEQSGTGRTHERRFDMSLRGRLMSSWHGRRNLGQKLVQVAISGVGSEAEAREDFKRRMPELIVAQT
jgi:exosortase